MTPQIQSLRIVLPKNPMNEPKADFKARLNYGEGMRDSQLLKEQGSISKCKPRNDRQHAPEQCHDHHKKTKYYPESIHGFIIINTA